MLKIGSLLSQVSRWRVSSLEDAQLSPDTSTSHSLKNVSFARRGRTRASPCSSSPTGMDLSSLGTVSRLGHRQGEYYYPSFLSFVFVVLLDHVE